MSQDTTIEYRGWIIEPETYSPTAHAGARDKQAFQTWCTRHGVDAVGPRARSGLGAPGHVLRLPRGALEVLAHDQSGRAAFAAVRLRTTAAKRYEKVENATAVIWKTLLIAEWTFRRLDAPGLLAEVANDVSYTNGVRHREKKVAA